MAKALTPDPGDPAAPRPAAVCVYGDSVPDAIAALGDAHAGSRPGREGGIAVVVAAAFPSGRASLAVKLADTAVAAGADEIDMVIDRGAFLSGRIGLVFDEIVAVKEACHRADGTYAHLKVILETGELNTYDNVRRASWLSILAGADFIKTSAARPRTLFSTMRRSTRRLRASSTASSSTRAMSAARAPVCWCRSRFTTRSSTG